MRVKSLHKNHIMPTKGSNTAAGYDIYMPEAGSTSSEGTITVALGFAAEVPEGYVALLLPRSSSGGKYGLELNNTCGVIDSDYRGEWLAVLKTKSNTVFSWKAHERVLQFLLVPVLSVTLEASDELSPSTRDQAGFGSSGK